MLHLKQSGFTLIELVMVIMLLAILSYSATGLFSQKSHFTSLTGKNQFLASMLLAQQQALAYSDNSQPISLRLEQTSTHWLIDVCRGSRTVGVCQSPATLIDANTIERSNAALKINNSTFTGNQTFTFDRLGNLNPRTQNYRLDFISNSTHTVCLSTSGLAFAYIGNCPWE